MHSIPNGIQCLRFRSTNRSKFDLCSTSILYSIYIHSRGQAIATRLPPNEWNPTNEIDLKPCNALASCNLKRINGGLEVNGNYETDWKLLNIIICIGGWTMIQEFLWIIILTLCDLWLVSQLRWEMCVPNNPRLYDCEHLLTPRDFKAGSRVCKVEPAGGSHKKTANRWTHESKLADFIGTLGLMWMKFCFHASWRWFKMDSNGTTRSFSCHVQVHLLHRVDQLWRILPLVEKMIILKRSKDRKGSTKEATKT